MFRVPGHEGDSSDGAGTGQRLAEQVAESIGSWRFIAAQAAAMAVWVLINTLVFFHAIQFDTYPFVFLNLAMSAEAAFTGPVLLIAANVGAMRDHKQYDRIEHLTAKTEDLGEKSRELANRLIEVERQLDTHVSQSIQAHTTEIRELCDLVRAMHAVVVQMNGQTAGALPSAPDQTLQAMAPAPAASPADTPATATPQEAPAALAPRRTSSRPDKRR
jgi:uncharacterized membrane protein